MTTEPRIVSNLNYRVMAAYLRFRERFRKPEETVRMLGIEEGHKVLDFGCGIGSYSIPVSRLVGESGRVYALDVHPLAVERVEKRAEKLNLSNIVTIQSGLETGLDDQSCDFALMFDVYSWVSNKKALLNEIHRVLTSEGKLSVIIDHTCPEDFVVDVEQFGGFEVELREENFFILSKKAKTTTRSDVF